MRSLATVLRVSSAVMEDRDQNSLTSFSSVDSFNPVLMCWEAHSFRETPLLNAENRRCLCSSWSTISSTDSQTPARHPTRARVQIRNFHSFLQFGVEVSKHCFVFCLVFMLKRALEIFYGFPMPKTFLISPKTRLITSKKTLLLKLFILSRKRWKLS